MTIETQQVRIIYEGDGASTDFAVPFPFIESAHLRVYTGTGALGSADTLLTEGREYAVRGRQTEGGGWYVDGEVILAAPLAENLRLAVLREVPLTQLVDYPAGGRFPAASHEMALDKLTMEVQQLHDLFSRTPYGPPTSGASGEIILGEMERWHAQTGDRAAAAALDAARAASAADAAELAARGAGENAERAAALVDAASLASSVFNVRKAWTAGEDVPAGGTLILPAGYYPTRDVLYLACMGTVCAPRAAGLETSGAWQYEEVGDDPDILSNRVIVHFPVRAGDVLDMWVVTSAAGRNLERLEAIAAEAEVAASEAESGARRAAAAAASVAAWGEMRAVRAVWMTDAAVAPGGIVPLPVAYHPGRDVLLLHFEGALCSPHAAEGVPPEARQYEEIGNNPAVPSREIVTHFAVPAGSRMDLLVMSARAAGGRHVARAKTVVGPGGHAAGQDFIVPAYTVGTDALTIHRDGLFVNAGDAYAEHGAAGTASTAVRFAQTLPAGTTITATVVA